MAKSAPFSMRLPPETDVLISQEAARTDRSKGSVVASLAEEALKSRLFPGLAFRGKDWERRPWVIGTSLDVWQIVRAWQDFGSIDSLVAETDVDERHVQLALAYYERFPAEIDTAIADDRRSIDDLRREFPSIPVLDS